MRRLCAGRVWLPLIELKYAFHKSILLDGIKPIFIHTHTQRRTRTYVPAQIRANICMHKLESINNAHIVCVHTTHLDGVYSH